MTNIYISNLSPNVGNEELNQIFIEYGNVTSAKVIFDKYTGKSKRFGFVEMQNDDEADNAIKKLNKAKIDGYQVEISIAKPKTERTNFSQGFNNNRRREY
jgi:RNA recognition motif-containing protein